MGIGTFLESMQSVVRLTFCVDTQCITEEGKLDQYICYPRSGSGAFWSLEKSIKKSVNILDHISGKFSRCRRNLLLLVLEFLNVA